MSELWGPLIGVSVGLVIVWIALLIALIMARPKDISVSDALRLLPDVVVLLRRLGADSQLPQGVRLRLLLLLAYLIMPIDIVPDFIPFLGYADDAIVVVIALRSVARRAGPDAIEEHWPGTPEGLHAVRRLIGLSSPPET